jgi:sortase A
VDFKGKRYIYRVTTTKVVTPNDVSVLGQTKTPTLTLITCTPVGTSKNRFIVQARQVSPDPSTAEKLETTQYKPITTSKIPN